MQINILCELISDIIDKKIGRNASFFNKSENILGFLKTELSNFLIHKN